MDTAPTATFVGSSPKRVSAWPVARLVGALSIYRKSVISIHSRSGCLREATSRSFCLFPPVTLAKVNENVSLGEG